MLNNYERKSRSETAIGGRIFFTFPVRRCHRAQYNRPFTFSLCSHPWICTGTPLGISLCFIMRCTLSAFGRASYAVCEYKFPANSKETTGHAYLLHRESCAVVLTDTFVIKERRYPRPYRRRCLHASETCFALSLIFLTPLPVQTLTNFPSECRLSFFFFFFSTFL